MDLSVTAPRREQITASTAGDAQPSARQIGHWEIRHCALCLQICAELYLCNGCSKRAYCSFQCQAQDWPRFGKGQGHVDWCKLDCCEEDIDWQVKPIPGKGLGVVAIKNIAAGRRIMVEHAYTDAGAHPAIKDLSPAKAGLREKFDWNCTGSPYTSQRYVSLRRSRVNHACQANAVSAFCGATIVSIVLSEREIQTGEEICFNYHPDPILLEPHNVDISSNAMIEQGVKRYLLQAWGITCPADCFCKSKRANDLIRKAIVLNRNIDDIIKTASFEPFSEPDNTLFAILDSIPVNPFCGRRFQVYQRAVTFVDFQLCQLSMKRKMDGAERAWYAILVRKLQYYALSAYRIHLAVSPFSKGTKILQLNMEKAELMAKFPVRFHRKVTKHRSQPKNRLIEKLKH